MRFKNLLCFLFLFCSLSLFGAKSDASISTFDYSRFDRSLRFNVNVFNPDNLLSKKEEALLKAKLDAIDKKSNVRISIFFFANLIDCTSEKFAVDIYYRWFGTYPKPETIMIVYNDKKRDLGYYKDKTITSDTFYFQVEQIKDNLRRTSKGRKIKIYPLIVTLLDDIDKQLYANQDREKPKVELSSKITDKKYTDKESKKAEIQEQVENKDKNFTTIFTIITSIALLIWILFKVVIARTQPNRIWYLLKKVFLNGLFFLTIYPLIFVILHAIVFSKQEHEYLVYSDKMIKGFMFYGWALTLITIILIHVFIILYQSLFGRNKVEPVSPEVLLSRFSGEYQGEYQAIDQSTRVLHRTGDTALLNINRATFEQIINMPGELHFRDAERIIQARRNSGLFEDIEDLQRRSRLSEQLINDLRPRIYFFEENDNRIFHQTTRSSSSTPANKVKNTESQVDINTATSEQIRELSALLTIMDVRRIVQERDTNGDFKNFKDLRRRSNLADTLIKDIEKKVCFSNPKDESSENGKREGKRIVDL